jgi:hypothetical protein
MATQSSEIKNIEEKKSKIHVMQKKNSKTKQTFETVRTIDATK